jgi:predicted alpha/beta superfamily hydrolase
MPRVTKLLVIGILCLSCSREFDQAPVDRSTPAASSTPAYLAGTSSRRIKSSKTDREYQVSVALPRGYEASTASYPVLFALDANGELGTVVETARLLQLEGLIPELVVVGIGYPVGHYFDAIGKRVLDLTVSEDPEFQATLIKTLPAFPEPDGTGGAALFLQFLTEELIPLMEKEYRVDPSNRALLGHSFGGLFAFYALLHGEGGFHRFLVSSPALWWDDRVVGSFDSS